MMQQYDVVVIGGGPAGLAAALSCLKSFQVLILERENRLGGILKQCIHDGFGVIRYHEKLTGPEYVQTFIEQIKTKDNIKINLLSFVIDIKKVDDHYTIIYVNQNGINIIETKNIILATGCRERTRNQIQIPGSRGVGIYTAGVVQNLVNVLGVSPCRKPLILGSGDIGLIMARRLTLEGAKVVGVYDIKDSPSGLMRNIYQCLKDYNIPLHLSKTVTKIFGKDRIEKVEIASVDKNMNPISGSEEIVECDSLILAVGLIPENEIAEKLNIPIDNKTKGPFVDQTMMTLQDGVFACGNCLHVNDLVDYVSESGEIAGNSISNNNLIRKLIPLNISDNLLYLVPQYININKPMENTIIFFRSKKICENAKLTMIVDGVEVFSKKYRKILPPEMERLVIDFSQFKINLNSKVEFKLKEE